MSEPAITVGGGIAVARPASPRARPGRDAARPLLTADRLAWASMAGLVFGGVATVLCSAHTAVLSPDSVRPLPPMLQGPLGAIGPDIHLGGVIGLFTLMYVCYAGLLRFGRRLSAHAIVGGVVVLHVLMALAPPLLSTDVFSYGIYGRMSAVDHFNPYVLGPKAISWDAWYPFVGHPWISTPTAYGPLFTAISYLLGHLSVGTAALAYKLLAVACSLATVAGVARAAQRLGHDPLRAVLLVGLNPVLIVYTVGGAHNDLMMLAALVWAVVALIGHRARTAGGLLVVSAAVKLTSAILLPFALAAREPVRRHQPRVLAGAVLVLLGVGIVSTAMFGLGPLHLLSTLEVIQSNGGRQSIPGFIAWGLGLGRLSHGLVIGLQVALIITVAGLLVAVRRHRIDWLTATGWAIAALLVTSTFLLPWYAVWLLPFAALSDSRALRIACAVLTGICMTSL